MLKHVEGRRHSFYFRKLKGQREEQTVGEGQREICQSRECASIFQVSVTSEDCDKCLVGVSLRDPETCTW